MFGFVFVLVSSARHRRSYLLLISRFGSLGLDRFDPRDQASVLANFAGRIQSLGLRLETQAKQRLGRVVCGSLKLLVAHFAELGIGGHLNRPSVIVWRAVFLFAR